MSTDATRGLPGKPGEKGTDQHGGAGGAGGVGGEGGTTGGVGGAGGAGGEFHDQAVADRKELVRLGKLNAFRTSTIGVVLFYGYLVAILIASLLIGKTILDNRSLARQSHRALCTLKSERERRVEQTADILAHPNRPENAIIIESLGRNLLVRSLATAKADARALKDVSC